MMKKKAISIFKQFIMLLMALFTSTSAWKSKIYLKYMTLKTIHKYSRAVIMQHCFDSIKLQYFFCKLYSVCSSIKFFLASFTLMFAEMSFFINWPMFLKYRFNNFHIVLLFYRTLYNIKFLHILYNVHTVCKYS